MENCFLTIGPPGTGKTTRLIQKAGEAASRWGGNQVLICSLTRTAAANVKERGVPIPMQQVGTFHSHCYRRLGSPEIAETHIDEWNAENPNCPLTGTKGKGADLDSYGGEIPGDRSSDLTFSRYTMSRARMLPRDRWKAGVLEFADRWESWKKANDYLDFEDLIERCREDYDSAPGNPSIVYVDEAQDCSASEVALAAKWSQNAKVVFTGDLDQTIFSFRGATPRAFYDLKIPEKNRIVLGESHRLPERVHATAMEWISRSFGREQVSYRPRGFEGRVRYAGLYSKAPEGIIRDAEEYLARGKTVMIIGTCGYHVDPVINELRRRGIPFHNPYRESNGKWNPLGGRSGVSSSERILAFLRPQETGRWSIEDLAKWIEVVSADVLLRGAKRLVAERAKAEPPQDLTDDEIMGLFEDSDMALKAIQAAWAGDAEWLQKNLLASKSGPFNFPMEILRKNGKQALTEQPRVTVGTIHSVKGGEADVVYLLPDLSQKSCESWDGYPEDKAEVYRVFYVGMTRAREELILCDAIGNLRVRWN